MGNENLMIKKISLFIRSIPVPLLALLVTVLALILRVINADHLNNNILDLHARQASMAIDIIRGHFHFPNAPWIFEYDESGLAWLMVPWVLIFGHKWVVFRLFGAILTSIIPNVITWVGIRHWNRLTGLAAGIFIASLPAQMVRQESGYVCTGSFDYCMVYQSRYCFMATQRKVLQVFYCRISDRHQFLCCSLQRNDFTISVTRDYSGWCSSKT